MLSKIVMATALMLGSGMLANGTLMILAPEAWYWKVPGVADRGAFNQHFIRDIGINYLLIGMAFIGGAVYVKHRILLWLMPTSWLTGHALFHGWEVLVGICSPAAMLQDFMGVTLPALLGIALILLATRQMQSE